MGNANERAWETQKKALYTRFSQSLPLLPSLNGYGELVGNLSNCAATNSCHPDSELKDTAAESFIRDGLSKVMKITNICDSEHLSDCGLPNKIIPINEETAINLSSIKDVLGLNSKMISANGYFHGQLAFTHEQLNTKAAAFETANGESILVYYNPYCEPNLGESEGTMGHDVTKGYFTQPKMCANFVFDLNGAKGPNTVGKDIGVITALYSTDPVIVSPNPYPNDSSTGIKYADNIGAKCKEFDINAKAPTIDELTSIFYNMKFFAISSSTYHSSSKVLSLNRNWLHDFDHGNTWTNYSDEFFRLRCVKR